MRKTYQIFAYLLAALVVIQAAAIAYGLAGLTKWVDDDGGVLNKANLDDHDALHFQGVGGFAIHSINGTMFIPLVTILFLVFSFFSKVPGASKRAGMLFVMVAVQIALGLTASSVPVLGPLHAINGFAIFSLAVMTGVMVGRTAPVTTSPAPAPVNA
jgi:heme A synthase